jgi:peptide-methionine (S)-S-oxide reductase
MKLLSTSFIEKIRAFALAAIVSLLPNAFATTMNANESNQEIATLAGGCFWCTEAVYERLEGVSSVVSGYIGGSTANPTYQQISKGDTGHAEAIQVTFDPAVISYAQLLDIFWEAHDPTTLNRQGADIGTQYRSAIFYHSDGQRQAAEASRAAAQAKFEDPIVTEITAATNFYEAEGYHQDFYEQNKTYPYCRVVITPKLKKLGL